MESNNSSEIPDKGETSDNPGLPSGLARAGKMNESRSVYVIGGKINER